MQFLIIAGSPPESPKVCVVSGSWFGEGPGANPWAAVLGMQSSAFVCKVNLFFFAGFWAPKIA